MAASTRGAATHEGTYEPSVVASRPVAASDMTESEPTWTLDALRIHFDRMLEGLEKRMLERFDASESRLEAALGSAKEAVDKAQATQTAINMASNEWRATLTDERRLMMPRVEIVAQLNAMNEKLALTNTRLDRIEGTTSGVSSTLYAIVSIVALLISLAVGVGSFLR